MDKDDLSFGKRYGYEPVDLPFQVESMNDTLRTDLWNGFYLNILSPLMKADSKYAYVLLHKKIWAFILKKPLDSFNGNPGNLITLYRQFFETHLWYKVFELCEYVLIEIVQEQGYRHDLFCEWISRVLIENNAGYSLMNNRFVPVMNQTEVKEILSLQTTAKELNLGNVQEHLHNSLELIAKKPTPDFGNSIKESICMVEAMCRLIEPTEQTLGKALHKLEEHQRINPVLKSAFEKLYSFTNGKNGIRHALMEEKDISIEDARFFLIACSAFTNYLIEKAIKENLL